MRTSGPGRSSHEPGSLLRSVVRGRRGDTYESGRVVVTSSLGVSVSLQNRVSLDDLILQCTFLQF